MNGRGIIAVFALAAAGVFALLSETANQKPGDRMGDGTVYADTSPDTRKSLFVTPTDAPGTYNWDKGKKYCETLESHGHKDWRLPTDRELSGLYNNRAAVGGFNETGSIPVDWYWSSTEHRYQLDYAWYQRFSDGDRGVIHKETPSSVRCVR
jgi:Protein of unknown function (DUF1566)